MAGVFDRINSRRIAPEALIPFNKVSQAFLPLEIEIRKVRSAVQLADLAVNEKDAAWARRREIFNEMAREDLRSPDKFLQAEAEADEIHEKIDRTSDWLLFAARAAVFAINEYHGHLVALEETARSHDLGGDFATKTKKDFKDTFPEWKSARDAVAHTGEIARDIEKNSYVGAIKKGSIQVPARTQILIADTMDGRTLTMTRKGHLIKLEIDHKLLEKLEAIHRLLEDRLIAAVPLREENDPWLDGPPIVFRP